MNQNPSAISIIRTRLPYLDRGALSRAWFEALGLAASQPQAVSPVHAPQAPAGSGQPLRSRVVAAEAHSPPAVRLAPVSRRTSAPAISGDVAKRRARPRPRSNDALSAARPVAAPARVSQMTLSFDGGRVQVVVRRRADRLELIALCTAHRVEAVRRALAGVELELRGAHLRTASHVAALAFA